MNEEHKDFLGKALNIGDEVVFCESGKTSRWLDKWIVTKMMDKCCFIKVTSPEYSWRIETRKDYKFIIKI